MYAGLVAQRIWEARAKRYMVVLNRNQTSIGSSDIVKIIHLVLTNIQSIYMKHNKNLKIFQKEM